MTTGGEGLELVGFLGIWFSECWGCNHAVDGKEKGGGMIKPFEHLLTKYKTGGGVGSSICRIDTKANLQNQKGNEFAGDSSDG